jgi:site-specific DNA-methyltransferase (adenine-specific)
MKLIMGDCLEGMKSLADGSVDLVLADLPYGTTDCEWDSIIPLEPLWKELRRVAKRSAAIVLTADQPFTTALIASNLKEFRYCWTWVKEMPTGFLNAKKMPLKNTEDVCVFYRELPTYNPQGVVSSPFNKHAKRGSTGGIYAKNGLRYDSDYIPEFVNYPKQTIRCGKDMPQVHPTQKPVFLMSYLIKTYTNEHETVLDVCMGSGSTGVACQATNRNFIGFERDPAYFELSKRRIGEAASPFDNFRPAQRPAAQRPARVRIER